MRKRRLLVVSAVSVVCGLGVSRLVAEDIDITQSNTEIKTTLYQYDAGGSQSSVAHPSSITYQYDSNNQETNPITHVTTYSYDALEMVTQTPAAGNTFTYTYDDDGANGGAFAGSGGVPDPHTAGGRTYTYDYDANAGGYTQYSDTNGRTTTYIYDAVGSGGASSVSNSDPNGNTTTYTYDAVDRVIRGNTDSLGETVGDDTQSGSVTFTPLETFMYDGVGRMAGAGHLSVELQDVTDGDAVLFRYTYEYDPILRPLANTYGPGNTPGSLTGSFTGELDPTDTYLYTYSYDSPLGNAASAEMDLDISPVPLPRTAFGGALLMGGIALSPLLRRRRASLASF